MPSHQTPGRVRTPSVRELQRLTPPFLAAFAVQSCRHFLTAACVKGGVPKDLVSELGFDSAINLMEHHLLDPKNPLDDCPVPNFANFGLSAVRLEGKIQDALYITFELVGDYTFDGTPPSVPDVHDLIRSCVRATEGTSLRTDLRRVIDTLLCLQSSLQADVLPGIPSDLFTRLRN